MDYNLFTGDYIESKADDSGKMISSKDKKDKKELMKLVDFIARLGEEQLKFNVIFLSAYNPTYFDYSNIVN